MPAAAVIPAPIAYMNVVAVKKPVVGFESFANEVFFWFRGSLAPSGVILLF